MSLEMRYIFEKSNTSLRKIIYIYNTTAKFTDHLVLRIMRKPKKALGHIAKMPSL